MKIALDAGHGYTTTGKQTTQPIPVKEWTLNNRVCIAIADYLSQYDCEILRVDDPTGATDVPLQDRVDAANAWGADLYLCIHHNAWDDPAAYNDPTAHGIEVWKSIYDGSNFADQLFSRITEYTQLSNHRGVKADNWTEDPLLDGYFVIRETNMTAYLVEGGFMTHGNDIPIITTTEGSDAYGLAVGEVVKEFYQLKKVSGGGGTGSGYVYNSIDDATLTGTQTENIKTIFDLLNVESAVINDVNVGTNLYTTCDSKAGTLIINKTTDTRAVFQLIEDSGAIHTATFIDPSTFSGWKKSLTKAEEDVDDNPTDQDVIDIKAALGDIHLIEHYGATIVDILNKYTRQVMSDTSTVANEIKLENYFGDVHNIDPSTPILIQANMNSVNGTPGKVKFEKETYTIDGNGDIVPNGTTNVEYPLRKLDLTAASRVNLEDYLEVSAGDITKNMYYTIVKREVYATPGDVGTLTEIFVLIIQSTDGEMALLDNRVTANEAAIGVNDAFRTASALTKATITASTLLNAVTAAITTLNVSGVMTLNKADASHAIAGNLDIAKNLTAKDVGADTADITNITTEALDLSGATVTLKASPGSGDLVKKSYVDSAKSNAKTEVMNNFIVSTNEAPATGTPNTFYFQIES